MLNKATPITQRMLRQAREEEATDDRVGIQRDTTPKDDSADAPSFFNATIELHAYLLQQQTPSSLQTRFDRTSPHS